MAGSVSGALGGQKCFPERASQSWSWNSQLSTPKRVGFLTKRGGQNLRCDFGGLERCALKKPLVEVSETRIGLIGAHLREMTGRRQTGENISYPEDPFHTNSSVGILSSPILGPSRRANTKKILTC